MDAEHLEVLLSQARRQSIPPAPIGAGYGTRLLLHLLVTEIEELIAERGDSYAAGYNAGYEDGVSDGMDYERDGVV